MTPTHEALTRAPVADDIQVLDHAARNADLRELAQGQDAVERLWDTCQLPDYRRFAPAAHAELVVTLYNFLMRKGCIPDNWFAAQIAQADRTDGDIDALSARIAQIRTWTFAANRPDWLRDPEHWQATTRAIEDKLSDALHERLTERFVDRRTSVLMRRLRENTTLETEIGKTGEVIVEGHTIGRLDGFTFAPDAAEAGSEAKALQAAAQKALAGEIDARATKLAAAPDDQFLLTSDGTVRWMGDAVGKLMAADNVLQPRLRLIADDRLSGAPREAVQTRLDLWLKTHIEKILGPMFELSNAADITGIGRGIAFQLVEAAGVLDRQKISAEMKDLDQPSRASLRKYGVRFGAYHIYLPNLLKPAARALASLLWSLKHDNLDLAALTTAQHLAGAGRTSFPVDKALDRDAYRVLGYKLAGERAVRVDILERLADLIRPALSWRPGSSLPKPPGAFDGRAFTVTQSMTSLTGSAGEDFASVLRSLGYRSEKRPPLAPEQVAAAEAPVETAVSQEILSEAAPEADALVSGASSGEATPSQPTVLEANETDAGPALATIEEAPVLAAATDATIAEPVAEVGSPTNDASVDIAAVAPVEQSSSEQATVEPTAPVEADESSAGDAAPAEPVAAADAPPIAPELVEVWRPGGRSDERQHQRPRHRRPEHARAQVSGEGATAETGERPPRDQQHRRDRKDFRGRRPEPRTDAPVPGAASGDATVGTPPSSQADARPRQERPRFQGKGGKPENRSSSGKPYQGNKPHQGRGDRNRGAPPREEYQRPAPKERPIDPNSPFAKLAALKEQLEKR